MALLKRWAIAGLLSGSCVIVFAATAFAGYAYAPGVYIDTTNRYAEGPLVGTRISANSVEYIGYIQYGGSSASFYAVDSAGTYRGCAVPGPLSANFLAQMASFNSQSWLQFSWDANTGYCQGIVTQTGSHFTAP